MESFSLFFLFCFRPIPARFGRLRSGCGSADPHCADKLIFWGASSTLQTVALGVQNAPWSRPVWP